MFFSFLTKIICLKEKNILILQIKRKIINNGINNRTMWQYCTVVDMPLAVT